MIALVGARQHRPAGVLDRDHEPLYDAGVIVTLDTETGSLERRLVWTGVLLGSFRGDL